MPEEVKKLIQEYQEGKITRRQFIRRAVVLTGSLAVLNRANPSPERLQAQRGLSKLYLTAVENSTSFTYRA